MCVEKCDISLLFQCIVPASRHPIMSAMLNTPHNPYAILLFLHITLIRFRWLFLSTTSPSSLYTCLSVLNTYMYLSIFISLLFFSVSGSFDYTFQRTFFRFLHGNTPLNIKHFFSEVLKRPFDEQL